MFWGLTLKLMTLFWSGESYWRRGPDSACWPSVLWWKDSQMSLNSSTNTFKSKRLFSPHSIVLYSSMLCWAVQSHPGTDRINTSYFAVLSHNPTWQPCSTSDRGNTTHEQIGRNRHGICSTLIRSNRIWTCPQTWTHKRCMCMLIISACAFTHISVL